jgi:ribosome biogenesis GTPase
MAIVVVSACDPLPDLEHTDRVLAQAGLSLPEPPLLCITKPDLVEISSSLAAYRDLYEVHVVCNLTRQGLGSLRKSLAGKIAVLAGKSGVGKSSLLNALCPGLTLKVGELSDKSQAGTHTTRHSQLHTPLPEVGIFDTPGFSSLDMRCSARELASARAFPEVAAAPEACRFRDCLHRGEPGCAVKFRDTRYQSYLTLLREALERQDANLPPNQEDGYQGSQQLASKYRQLSRRRQKQSPPTSESEEGSDASDVRD